MESWQKWIYGVFLSTIYWIRTVNEFTNTYLLFNKDQNEKFFLRFWSLMCTIYRDTKVSESFEYRLNNEDTLVHIDQQTMEDKV